MRMSSLELLQGMLPEMVKNQVSRKVAYPKFCTQIQIHAQALHGVEIQREPKGVRMHQCVSSRVRDRYSST